MQGFLPEVGLCRSSASGSMSVWLSPSPGDEEERQPLFCALESMVLRHAESEGPRIQGQRQLSTDGRRLPELGERLGTLSLDFCHQSKLPRSAVCVTGIMRSSTLKINPYSHPEV